MIIIIITHHIQSTVVTAMMNFLAPSSSGVADSPLHQLLAMGGPVMVVLLVMAILGFITFIYLMLLGALYAPRLSGKLKKVITLWQQNPSSVNPQTLRQQAGAWTKLNPLHHLVTNTIEAQQSGESDQQTRETLSRDAQQGLEPFEAPLKIIEVIAALAPLLGLLGTVLGMMEAFSAMAATEGRANASQLSGGIYEALTTTAAGLVVAIPFAALAAWIEFRLRRIHSVVNNTLVTVLSVKPDATAQQPEPVATPDARRQQAEPGNAQDSENYGTQRFAHATG